MKSKTTIFLAICVVCLGLSAFDFSVKLYPFNYPKSWPKPVYNFNNNPLTVSGVALGRQLFYDPILSADTSISCESCHSNYMAFAHVDHLLSHGINDSIGTRNASALVNLAWSTTFMWDGAINHLDMQALAPIEHPAEMGSNITTVVTRLQHSKKYRSLFFDAFGDSMATGQRLLQAIAQFELTLISADSKYDKVMRGDAVFTDQENKGYVLFKKNCNVCHTEPLFTNNSFANNGLQLDTFLQDFGRMKVTGNKKDAQKFKVPSLRNIERSQPYMHDGRYKTLFEVVNHYAKHIEPGPTLHPALQKDLKLTPNDKVDLMAFLISLTDEAFLFNLEHSYPRNK